MEYTIVFIFVIFFLFLLLLLLFKSDDSRFESDVKRAGRKGEIFATQIIKEVLKENDVLFTNVKVSFEGKDSELDNIIINNRGIFIIEVKNYSGELYGDEDDYEWLKSKVTDGGYFYQKTVKNPIKQVKRQVYILSSYLKQFGIKVWVEGYAFLVEMNSPVESNYILKTQKDINDAIHFGNNNNLTDATKNKIIDLLKEI